MAKITLDNGMVIEGSVEEIKAMAEAFGVKEAEELKEPEPTYRLVSGRDARVGDFVKFTEAPYSYLTSDKYYEIIDIDSDNDPQIIDEDGDAYDTHGDTYEIYEKVTEATAEPEPLKVGDYAKVVKSIEGRNGEVVEIIGDDISTHDFKVETVVGCRVYGAFTTQLVKAAEEEVAEAKETERWAKIGRKPGEYKEGDIVRVVESTGMLPVGTIGEIGCSDGDIYRVNTVDIDYGNWHLPERIELITPVEARFDRA